MYAISFTVGAEAGLALVVSTDEKSAIGLLKTSGSRNWSSPNGYQIVQCRDMGVTDSCYSGLLMESFVNAVEAFAAIVSAANRLVGPKGDTGAPGARGEKGEKGDPGAAANFRYIWADIDSNTGVPSVDVEAIGTDAMKDVLFHFHNIKGEQGLKGEPGVQGPTGLQGETGERGPAGVETASATVDASYGTPSVNVSVADGNLSLSFHNLKGDKGDPGASNGEMYVVASLPEASAETEGKFYLVQVGSSDVYNRFITQYDGSNHSWVQVGTTEMHLVDYVRKDSIVYLTEQEWNDLEHKDVTKEYRIYEDE